MPNSGEFGYKVELCAAMAEFWRIRLQARALRCYAEFWRIRLQAPDVVLAAYCRGFLGVNFIVISHCHGPKSLGHGAVTCPPIVPAPLLRAGHLLQPVVEMNPAQVVEIGGG